MLTDRPGTYVLWLRCAIQGERSIGKLGTLHLQPGYYAYVGSAFGPGGLRARIQHHLRTPKRPHWHIDYLREVTIAQEIWFIHGDRCMEHRWAGRLAQLPEVRIPLAGFGSSDCRCPAHLFHCKSMLQPFPAPRLQRFRT